MADVQFVHAVDSGHGTYVVIGQSMTGVQAHSGLANELSRLLELLEFFLLPAAATGQGILSGVKFDGRHVQCGGHLKLSRVRIEEKADGDPRLFEAADDFLRLFLLTGDVQAALGCNLLTTFGYERDLIRLDLAGDRQHRGITSHFEVEFDGDCLAENPQITVLNVAAILAKVNGNAVVPPNSDMAAAQTGSGSKVLRASRTVAT